MKSKDPAKELLERSPKHAKKGLALLKDALFHLVKGRHSLSPEDEAEVVAVAEGIKDIVEQAGVASDESVDSQGKMIRDSTGPIVAKITADGFIIPGTERIAAMGANPTIKRSDGQ